MKKIILLLAISISSPVYAHDMMSEHEHSGMHAMMNHSSDSRISLGLNEQQKQHQLANMRSHLEAVQDILVLISEDKFEDASKVAHQKLGLTPEMKKMCNMFSNQDFRNLGLNFHKSADKLGDVLTQGNLKNSLKALHTTMNACIKCHATFRQ